MFTLPCRYVRRLEQTVIDMLSCHGITGARDPINSGVFVNQDKLSAVGITASRWITMHGIAVNVNCEMNGFQQIVPCGIAKEGYGVCRLVDLLAPAPPAPGLLEQVSGQLLSAMEEQFSLRMETVEDPLDSLEELLHNYPEIEHTKPVALRRSN